MALPPLSRLTAPSLPSPLPPLAVSLAPAEAAKLAAQFSTLPPPTAGNPPPTLPATVLSSTPLPTNVGGGAELVLQLPDGRTITARSPTPVPTGSVIQLPPPPAPTASTIPTATPAATPLATPNLAPTPTPATPTPVVLRALLQAPATTPIPPQTIASALPQPAAITLPTLQLTSPIPTPAALVPYPASTAIPGPLPLQPTQALPANWASQPLTLTLQTPTRGTLQPATPPTPGAPRAQAIPVQLSAGLNLPLRTEISIIIPNTQDLTNDNPVIIPYKQELGIKVGFITQSSLLSTQPTPSPTSTPLLSALRLLVPAETPTGQQLGRVLPPTPQTPAGLQPVLLASGQLAQLEVVAPTATAATPQPPSLSPPLLTGTVLRVNIPTLGGPAQILQLHSHQPQVLPQAPGQTAQAVTPPQTPQAVLAPDSVVAGTITGQNTQGQPLLTLTTPSPLAGQTFALSLTENQVTPTPLAATLVVGAKVQVQIGTNGAAQLLALELPPAAARATTLAGLGARWENLTQTLNLLQAANPNVAAQARANLPALANLLPGLVRLLEGIREQNPAKLLGAEAARLANAVGNDLTPDLQQLNQLLAKPPEDPTQWRGFIIPYLENPDGQPQQGSFFFRRETEDDPRSPSATRFVAELNLSNLGPVQLDGLVTYPEIWLKLRFQRPPPADFTAGLQALVAPLLAGLQLGGGISTETVPVFPVNPAATLRAAAETALGISS